MTDHPAAVPTVKPCPFCGKAPYVYDNYGGANWTPENRSVKCQTDHCPAESRIIPVTVWNRRAAPQEREGPADVSEQGVKAALVRRCNALHSALSEIYDAVRSSPFARQLGYAIDRDGDADNGHVTVEGALTIPMLRRAKSALSESAYSARSQEREADSAKMPYLLESIVHLSHMHSALQRWALEARNEQADERAIGAEVTDPGNAPTWEVWSGILERAIKTLEAVRDGAAHSFTFVSRDDPSNPLTFVVRENGIATVTDARGTMFVAPTLAKSGRL